jgi:hypothetical protein
MFTKTILEDLQMILRKRVKLESLPDGSPFLIGGMENDFYCLYLVRGGDSTCKVQGFKRSDSGNFTHFLDFFSPATEVNYDDSRVMLTISKDGELSIPKEYQPVKDKDKEETEKPEKKKKQKAIKALKPIKDNDMNTIKQKAGRPKKHTISLPKNQTFTIDEIAKTFGVKKFVINNEIARVKKENPSALQIVGSLPNTKGKPAKVFKLI